MPETLAWDFPSFENRLFQLQVRCLPSFIGFTVEADFFMAVKWKSYLGSAVSRFPYQKQIHPLPELSESSGTGQASGLVGIGISRQGIQNILLFILCNTSASTMVLVQNALL